MNSPSCTCEGVLEGLTNYLVGSTYASAMSLSGVNLAIMIENSISYGKVALRQRPLFSG